MGMQAVACTRLIGFVTVECQGWYFCVREFLPSDFYTVWKSYIHIADYLKDLADRELEDRKLIVVGIPRTGQRLGDLAFDLATRIDVYRLGRVRDETVIRMIEIGETALNIQFDRRADIARAASGSLNIAQLLCFHLAAAAGVLGTQAKRTVIRSEVRSAVATVIEQISLKFGETIRTFAALGDRRDTTAIEILQQLARAEEGFRSLPRLRDVVLRPKPGDCCVFCSYADRCCPMHQERPSR